MEPGAAEADAAAPRIESFENVDESTLQPWMIDYLERVGRRPDMQRVDAVTHRLLRLAPGDRVLEVGSGLGDDAVALARIVGPSGHVTAVDLSSDFVALARRRAREAGVDVEFHVGDMAALDLPDAAFHGVRGERSAQYTADPGAVVAELTRVVRPGGHVVLAEPDWGSMAADIDDIGLVNEITTWWLTTLRAQGFHPRIGLQLPGLFHRAGLVDIEVEVVTVIERSRDGAGELLPLFIREAPPEMAFLTEGVPRYHEWRDALDAAESTGSFVATLQMWVAGGRRPGA